MRSMVEGRAQREREAHLMIKGSGKAYRISRALRRTMSLPEVILWQRLRRQATGYKWRKQHPAGPYSLDFYCDALKLCVEVDGEAHGRGNEPARDARRNAWLAARGIETLRIPAAEVMANLDGVLAWIEVHARKRAPLHRPADGPPPPGELGED
jgi:very-short-patch-repair endonuclease